MLRFNELLTKIITRITWNWNISSSKEFRISGMKSRISKTLVHSSYCISNAFTVKGDADHYQPLEPELVICIGYLEGWKMNHSIIHCFKSHHARKVVYEQELLWGNEWKPKYHSALVEAWVREMRWFLATMISWKMIINGSETSEQSSAGCLTELRSSRNRSSPERHWS
jgi:hypothetical protein